MKLEVMRMKQTRVIHVRLGEKCMCCNQVGNEGLHVFKSFICHLCEKEIVGVECEQEHYQHYISNLRDILPSEKHR
ncbi:sigma factor G inhibitor Gin [Alkalihalophilus sp. As8PL]|uniref:Sigma factor G inhibitor Gin n=1 Tax=Alkalihalophilus sp. As8PL TaxID=3237103 RepID=A0AB39BYA8_9BACI